MRGIGGRMNVIMSHNNNMGKEMASPQKGKLVQRGWNLLGQTANYKSRSEEACRASGMTLRNLIL